MYLVRVLPIQKGAWTDELSYFSRAALAPGQMVEITVRNKKTPGVVRSSHSVQEVKASVKRAPYSLKALRPPRGAPRGLPPALLTALERAAEYWVQPPGRILYEILPRAARTADMFPPQETSASPTAISQAPAPPMPRILLAPREVRIQEYVVAIRHAFSKGGSALLLTPTITEAQRLYAALPKALLRHTFLFHSGLAPRAQAKAWKEALARTHAIAAVMTPGFLGLPRRDWHTIIVEAEASPHYAPARAPLVDYRTLALWYAEARGAQCLLADRPLRVATLHAYRRGTFDAAREIPARLTALPTTRIVDMRGEDARTEGIAPKRIFSLLSEELRALIAATRAEGARLFLFAARRGLAPITVCQDCGTRVACTACGASVVLHRASPHHLFLCHACGALRDAHETCAHCGSWRLTALGVGIQGVARELRYLFPDLPLFLLDRDHTPTPRAAREAAAQFYATEGAVLLGTEMALRHLATPLPAAGVVSLDALFALPEWNVSERIYGLLTRLQEVVQHTLLIQTRRPDARLLTHVARGTIGAWYREELEERRTYGYPPFATLIKVTLTARAQSLPRLRDEVCALLAPFGFTLIPQQFRKKNGEVFQHGFLRLLHHEPPRRRRRGEKVRAAPPPWPNATLARALRALPSGASIEINPRTIL